MTIDQHEKEKPRWKHFHYRQSNFFSKLSFTKSGKTKSQQKDWADKFKFSRIFNDCWKLWNVKIIRFYKKLCNKMTLQ